MSDNIQYLSFSVCLISLSIIPSRPIHVVTNGKISFFLWLSNIPLYIYTPHFLYPFIYSVSTMFLISIDLTLNLKVLIKTLLRM